MAQWRGVLRTFVAFQTVMLPGTSMANWSRSRQRRHFPGQCEPFPSASALAYAVGPPVRRRTCPRVVEGSTVTNVSSGRRRTAHRTSTVTGVTSGVFCWR